MTKASKALALAILAISGLAITPAIAQNPAFTPGDLLMGFQLRSGTGSDQTVLVDLGDTATLFRDGMGYNLNIANIGSLLNNTFGIGAGNALQWYDNPNLYFGLIATWDNANPSLNLQNGDPERTIYVSKSRLAGGVEFVKNSTIANVSSDGAMATASNNIVSLQQVLETGSLNGSVAIPTATANTWENYNAFSGANQSTAFGAFTGGIQQGFLTGAYGTTFGGGIGAVEGALDLYRFQPVNDIAGQFNAGGAVRVGEFLGTVTINQTGQVSAVLTPVPEPTTAILGGFGMLALFGRRRRA